MESARLGARENLSFHPTDPKKKHGPIGLQEGAEDKPPEINPEEKNRERTANFHDK